MTIIKNQYIGITHPLEDKEKLLDVPQFVESWKQANCKHGIHLFDEVFENDSHYLVCDICDLEVHIKEIIIPDGKDQVLDGKNEEEDKNKK